MSGGNTSTGMAARVTDDLAKLHLIAACIIVMGGMILIVLVLWLAVSKYPMAADVAAVVGSVAAAIGTLTAAFFAMQVGESSKLRMMRDTHELLRIWEDAKARAPAVAAQPPK